MKSLWPEVEAQNIVTPLSILREQAALLGERTGNVVTARVGGQNQGQELSYTLSLVAPALDHYTYLILDVRHPVELYPARIMDHVRSRRFSAATVDEFLGALRDILGCDAVKRIIEVLMAQSAS